MNDDFVGGPIKTTSSIVYNDKHNKLETKSTHSSYPNKITFLDL